MPYIIISGHPNPELGGSLLHKLRFPHDLHPKEPSDAIDSTVLLLTVDEYVQSKSTKTEESTGNGILLCSCEAASLINPETSPHAILALRESVESLHRQMKALAGETLDPVIRFVFTFPKGMASLDASTPGLQQLMELLPDVEGVKYFYALLSTASSQGGLYFCHQARDQDFTVEYETGGLITLLTSLNKQLYPNFSSTDSLDPELIAYMHECFIKFEQEYGLSMGSMTAMDAMDPAACCAAEDSSLPPDQVTGGSSPSPSSSGKHKRKKWVKLNPGDDEEDNLDTFKRQGRTAAGCAFFVEESQGDEALQQAILASLASMPSNPNDEPSSLPGPR